MLRKLGVIGVVVLVAAPSALAAKPPRDRTTILVKFRVPAQAAPLVKRLGDTIAGTTATGVTIVRLDKHDQVEAKVARYRELPGVRYAEPNFIAHAAISDPNDPSLSNQWNLSKVQATAGWGVYPGAYATGNGVRIAVVDTGVDSTHPDLADGRVRTDLGGSCLSSSGCATGAAIDDNGHGTHVAGIAAAATNNAVGVAGLAFDSSLVLVKVLDARGDGPYSSISNGIVWAVDHGARVVNLSLGGTSFSQTLCDAVTSVLQRGAIVVAAAGNNGSSAPFYPAACPGAIGVGATTSSDARVRPTPTRDRRTSSCRRRATRSTRRTRAAATRRCRARRWRRRSSVRWPRCSPARGRGGRRTTSSRCSRRRRTRSGAATAATRTARARAAPGRRRSATAASMSSARSRRRRRSRTSG